MIVLHKYPLTMVDHVGFRKYSNTLQPLFKMVSRNTIKNDILKIYDYEKSKTMDLLGNNRSRIAITTECGLPIKRKVSWWLQRTSLMILGHFKAE